jgi:hypothetical protein
MDRILRSVLGTEVTLGGTGGETLGWRLGGAAMLFLPGAWTCRTVGVGSKTTSESTVPLGGSRLLSRGALGLAEG